MYNPFITQPTGVSNTARLRWAQFFITTSIFQLGALPWQSLWLSLACLHRWKQRCTSNPLHHNRQEQKSILRSFENIVILLFSKGFSSCFVFFQFIQPVSGCLFCFKTINDSQSVKPCMCHYQRNPQVSKIQNAENHSRKNLLVAWQTYIGWKIHHEWRCFHSSFLFFYWISIDTWNNVDGRNPAPVDMETIPCFIGFRM